MTDKMWILSEAFMRGCRNANSARSGLRYKKQKVYMRKFDREAVMEKIAAVLHEVLLREEMRKQREEMRKRIQKLMREWKRPWYCLMNHDCLIKRRPEDFPNCGRDVPRKVRPVLRL